MAECFNPCHSGDLQGVSKSDLDRYTDSLDKLLSEENGRRLFREFLTNTDRDGIKCLRLWEDCKTITKSKPPEKKSLDELLGEIENIIEKCEEVEELNVAIVKHLVDSFRSKNEKHIFKSLKYLKRELKKIMKNDYKEFREHILNVVKHL